MRCLIFDTQDAALLANDAITNRGRELFVANGYQLDGQGHVIGKRASDGADMPGDPATATWAVPEQRSTDSKWWLPHPEIVPQAGDIIDANGRTVVQYVMQDLPGVVIETFDPAWRPA